MDSRPADEDSLLDDAAFVRELERMEVPLQPRAGVPATPKLPARKPSPPPVRRQRASSDASDARRVRKVLLLMLTAGAIAAVLVFHQQVAAILTRFLALG